MTINILDGEGEIDKKELDFFLKGNTSLDDVDEPCPASWISIAGWKDIQTLVESADIFKTFKEDLKSNIGLFKTWFDFEKPE